MAKVKHFKSCSLSKISNLPKPNQIVNIYKKNHFLVVGTFIGLATLEQGWIRLVWVCQVALFHLQGGQLPSKQLHSHICVGGSSVLGLGSWGLFKFPPPPKKKKKKRIQVRNLAHTCSVSLS